MYLKIIFLGKSKNNFWTKEEIKKTEKEADKISEWFN